MSGYSLCILLLALLTAHSVEAFVVGTRSRFKYSLGCPLAPSCSRTHPIVMISPPIRHLQHKNTAFVSRLLQFARRDDNNDDNEDFDDRELVKVPRGRRRGKYYNDDTDDDYDSAASSNRGKSYFDEDEEAEDDDDDDEDEWFDEAQVDKELSELFENVVIPNPLLDSMDPDGAADRFWPELARDPRFWFDFGLLIAFLNFLSFVGPRDTLSDLPWWY